MKIPIELIDVDYLENASREPFAPETCQTLAESIAKHGLRQPVLVRRNGDRYKLIVGFRRYTAVATILQEKEIEAIVVDENDPVESNVLNLVENIEREDLTFYEECVALRKVFPPETTHTHIAKIISRSLNWVSIRRKMWELPEEFIKDVESGLLGPFDVENMLKRPPEERVAHSKMIRDAKQRGMSSRKIYESLVEKKKRGIPVPTKEQLFRMITFLFDKDKSDVIIALQYAGGEISGEDFIKNLGLDTRGAPLDFLN